MRSGSASVSSAAKYASRASSKAPAKPARTAGGSLVKNQSGRKTAAARSAPR